MSPSDMHARSACPEVSRPVGEQTDQTARQPSSGRAGRGDRSSAAATECIGHEQDSGCQCGSPATTMAPGAAAELDRLSYHLRMQDDEGCAADTATARTAVPLIPRRLQGNRQPSDSHHLAAAPASIREVEDYREHGVVSVPVKELESLVVRLRVAKVEMDNLRKVVDMQTAVILKLKAKICTRQKPAGSDVEPAYVLDIGEKKPHLLPPPTPDVLPDAKPSLLHASDASSAAESRPPDLRRLTRGGYVGGTAECTAGVLFGTAVPGGGRPGSDDNARSPTPPRGGTRAIAGDGNSAAAAATTGRDSPVTAPLSRGRDGPGARPASPGPSAITARAAAAAGQGAAYQDLRRLPAALAFDDAGFRANPPATTKPSLFCAALPAAPPSACRFGREESRSTEAEDGRTPAAAAGTAEWSWPAAAAAATARSSDAFSQPLGSRRRNVDPRSSYAAAGVRRCPLCQRAFSADVPTSEFQCHVLECDANGEGVDGVVSAATTTTSELSGGGGDDDDRTCPLCAAHYPAGVPRDEFEQHVLSHFQDE